MDEFKIPKKVNRHVIKAINILKKYNNSASISTDQILDQVKYQMRNLVPVPNVEMAIHKSLKNLSDMGVIENERRYDFKTSKLPPSAPPKNRNIFKASGSRKRSYSHLNPNSKIRSNSDESLSGNEYERTRKRMHTNNKTIKYAGRKTDLPKSRQHTKFKNCNFTVDFLSRSLSLDEQNVMPLCLPISNVYSFDGASSAQRLPKYEIFNDNFLNVPNQASSSTSMQETSENPSLTVDINNDSENLPKDSNDNDQESNNLSSKSKLTIFDSKTELNFASKSQMNNSVEIKRS